MNQTSTTHATTNDAAVKVTLRASLAAARHVDTRAMIAHAAVAMYADAVASELIARMPPLPRLVDGDADRAIDIATRELQRYGLEIEPAALQYAIGVQVGLRMAHLLKGGAR